MTLEQFRDSHCETERQAALANALNGAVFHTVKMGTSIRRCYRRLHVLLKREGYVINHKKLFRLYREERLAVRRRGGRKRAIGTRAPMTVAMAPNDRWSLDFVSDQPTDGRRFRILPVVDDCPRECLALVPNTSLSGTAWRGS